MTSPSPADATVSDMLDRAESEGWSRGLAYRVAKASAREGDYRVCVLCGWAWISVSNRCVNPECRGVCTWGAHPQAEPDSWVKLPGGGYRPRMRGEA